MSRNKNNMNWIMIFTGVIFSTQMAVAQLHVDRPFPICLSDSMQGRPNITCGNNYKFLVVWNDFRNTDVNAHDVYGKIIHFRRIGVDGGGVSVACNEFLISTQYNNISLNSRPCVAYNEDYGEYLVCWTDGDYVYGQRVSRQGNLIDENFVITETDCSMGMLTLTSNTIDANYLLTYRTNSSSRVTGIIINHTGETVIPPFTIKTGASWHQTIYNPVNNEFMVVWEYGGMDPRLRARRVSNLGVLLGNEIDVSPENSPQHSATVAYNSRQEEYLITWIDERNLAYATEIYARRFDNNGNAVSDDYLIIGEEFNLHRLPHIAYNSNSGGYLLTWDHQAEVYPLVFEVLALQLNPQGETAGTVIHFIREPELSQVSPKVAANPDGNRYLVIWTQEDNFSYDIYGKFIRGKQYIHHNGPQADNSGDIEDGFGLLQIYPNPFSERTDIRYQIEDNSETSIMIHDASGRLIRQFNNETIRQSNHVTWDGCNDYGKKVSAGIYFCHLRVNDFTGMKKILLIK